MLPQIHLEGNLTRAPELKFIPSGKAVASFSVACNDRRKNQQTGEWEDGDTCFMRVTAWELLAENVSESLNQGDAVVVTGRLKQGSYEKDGVKITTYDVTADTVGPSLRRATAKPVKAQRPGAQQPGQGHPDPWAQPPAQAPQGQQQGAWAQNPQTGQQPPAQQPQQGAPGWPQQGGQPWQGGQQQPAQPAQGGWGQPPTDEPPF